MWCGARVVVLEKPVNPAYCKCGGGGGLARPWLAGVEWEREAANRRAPPRKEEQYLFVIICIIIGKS